MSLFAWLFLLVYALLTVAPYFIGLLALTVLTMW
jgi:hypothetical protein